MREFRVQNAIAQIIPTCEELIPSTLECERPPDASAEASAQKSVAADTSAEQTEQDKPNQLQDKNSHGAERQVAVSDPRAKLRSWLGRILRIVITDGRIIVGYFACTDRDGNVILENAYEYTKSGDQEARMLGLALVPGKHAISIHLMT